MDGWIDRLEMGGRSDKEIERLIDTVMIYITIIDKEARSQRGLRRREGKLALILKAPAHNKLPAYKTFHIEILRL